MSELYIYQNARCKDKKYKLGRSTFLSSAPRFSELYFLEGSQALHFVSLVRATCYEDGCGAMVE